MPADLLGLDKRGRINTGNYADLVVFDKETIDDLSTFQDPHHYPEGIRFVLVNGAITVSEGKMTDSRNGHVLRGPAWAGNFPAE